MVDLLVAKRIEESLSSSKEVDSSVKEEGSIPCILSKRALRFEVSTTQSPTDKRMPFKEASVLSSSLKATLEASPEELIIPLRIKA